MHSIDLWPVISPVVNDLMFAAVAVAYFAVHRVVYLLGRWLHIRISAQAELALDKLLANGIQAGANAFEQLIVAKGWDHADTKSAIVAFAAPYVLGRAVPLLKSFGLNPNDPAATQAFVSAELNRIFAVAMAPVANSPVTAPLPAAIAPSPPGTAADDLNRAENAAIAAG